MVFVLGNITNHAELGFVSTLIPWNECNNVVNLYDREAAHDKINFIHPEASNWGLNLDGLDVPIQREHWNIRMTTCFGDLFKGLGLNAVTTLHDFVAPKESAINANVFEVLSSSAHDFIFSAIPCVDKLPSPDKNCAFQSEFLKFQGRQVMNNQFWTNHVRRYQRRDGWLIQIMELAAFIPTWCLHHSQLAEDKVALNWFASNNCGMGNDFVMLSLFDHYVQAYLTFMKSPSVQG